MLIIKHSTADNGIINILEAKFKISVKSKLYININMLSWSIYVLVALTLAHRYIQNSEAFEALLIREFLA